MTEKKKENDIVSDDVKEMANIYMELESQLSAAKLDVKPTSEDLQKMVVSLFIHRADSGSMVSRPAPAPAPAKKADPKFPDRSCPICNQLVGVRFGKDSGKPYYACEKDNVFVNDDGSTTARKPFKK